MVLAVCGSCIINVINMPKIFSRKYDIPSGGQIWSNVIALCSVCFECYYYSVPVGIADCVTSNQAWLCLRSVMYVTSQAVRRKTCRCALWPS